MERTSSHFFQLQTKGHTMYNASQFADFNKANVAQATKLAAIALENAEKVMKLNLNATKLVFAQGVENASAVAAVKDVQELIALPTKYAETGVQTVVGYSRSLYEISSEAQAQFSALAEEALAGYTKGLASWVEKASQSAPAGSEVAINAMKSTVAATSAAFDQFQKASKQVVSFADASVRAAAENATKVTAAPKGRKAA
jgi:phasin family protein